MNDLIVDEFNDQFGLNAENPTQNLNFAKVKMKLFQNFFIVSCVAAGKQSRTSYCNLDDLTLPDDAEKWDCRGTSDKYIPTGTKCFLQCDAGYMPTACEPSTYSDVYF